MQTSSFRKSSLRAATGAAYICLALALSFLESLIPFQTLIPIPGFKLGLANIVVILVIYRSSPYEALAVSLIRVILSSLLFGSVSSLLYSLAGALLSYISIFVSNIVFKGKLSFIGISVTSAVFHNLGQLLVAAYFFSFGAVIYLTPRLFICAVICGILTGSVLSALPRSIFFSKDRKNEKVL